MCMIYVCWRLGSKAPYPTSSTKVADNIDNNFCADNAPDLVSMKQSEEEFQPTIAASWVLTSVGSALRGMVVCVRWCACM